MNMKWPTPATAALIVLALGWGIFAAIYAFVPLPHHGWAKEKPGLSGAVATFDQLHYRDARRQFVALARNGSAAGEMWLGYMDEHGFGAARNAPAALAEYTKAAGAGSAVAARRLGEMYLAGDGVLQNVTAARPWIARAADEGDATAERDLGAIYAEGLGVAKDPAEAYAWLDIAASHGDALAARERDAVLKTLSPDALGAAQRLAQATSQTAAHPASPGAHAPAA
jgi:TPR repeat protein